MALSDIVYFGDRGYRLSVEFRADDGTWVDFNSSFPSYVPDYWRGLLREPSITVRSEDSTGIYAPAVDSLIMDNSPWQGFKYGFWDAPTPVTIRGKTFAQWYRRRVRLVLEVYFANELQASHTLATCLVESIVRRGTQATIKLSSIARLLQTRSADSLKIGSDWARSWPIAALIRMIVQRTDPTIEFASDFSSGVTDLGTFDTARCSSWGSVPGILSTGMPSADHWIPRCFAPDGGSTSRIFVGFEVPGASDVSDGAIGSFDLATGQWTIHHGPSEIVGQFPIWLWKPASGLRFLTVADILPSTSKTFYRSRYYFTSLSGALGSPRFQHDGYWPARETIRLGVVFSGSSLAACGAYSGTHYGEAACIPFRQKADALLDAIWGDNPGAKTFESAGYKIPGGALVEQVPLPGSSHGCGTIVTNGVGIHGVGARYFMGLQWHQPYTVVRSSVTYIQQIRLTPNTLDYELLIYKLSDDTTISRSFASVLGSPGEQLWKKQITAWASDGHTKTSSTEERVIIAVVDWDETSAASVRWSQTRLLACRFPGSDAATVTSYTIDNPSDGTSPDFARIVVGLWTPQSGEPLDVVSTEYADYVVGVVLNRASTQTPCYGIGLWNRSTDTTLTLITMFGTSGYTGPTSSMPFGGFVRDATDEQMFRFVDQATGQVWRCTLNVTLTTATWTLENKGQSAHATEFALSTVNGGYAVSNGQDVYLWGMSPGPTGEVTVGYPLRSGAKPSWVRRVPGLYPLVQLSKKAADAIEVADFSGLTAWDVLRHLRQIAWNHRMYFDGDGKLHFDVREAGTSQGRLQPIDMDGYVAPSGTSVPVDGGFEVYDAVDQIKNAVDVTPWGLQSAGKADQSPISAAGSTWAGDYLFEVRTERPLRLAITCANGGDVWASQHATAANQCAVLFRWQALAETLHHYLAVMCLETDTHVRVAGLNARSSTEIFSGEVQVRIGDFVRVADGTQRAISSVIAVANDYVDFQLAGAVDVDASAYSEVTIEPQGGSLASDSAAGITTLAVAYTSGTTLSVVDGSQINVDSVVRVRSSHFLVTAKQYVNATRTDLTVSLLYATAIPDASLPIGSPVRAYVYIKEVGRTYAVGATGVSFGVDVDENTAEAKERCLSAGDGLAITAQGLRLEALKHASIRAIDKTSIGDPVSGSGYGRKDLSISENRFVDPVKADLLSQQVLTKSAQPLTVGSGISMALLPSLTAGESVTCQDPRVSLPTSVGGDQSATFEITEVRYDISRGKQSMTIKSFNPMRLNYTQARGDELGLRGAPRGQRGNRE